MEEQIEEVVVESELDLSVAQELAKLTAEKKELEADDSELVYELSIEALDLALEPINEAVKNYKTAKEIFTEGNKALGISEGLTPVEIRNRALEWENNYAIDVKKDLKKKYTEEKKALKELVKTIKTDKRNRIKELTEAAKVIREEAKAYRKRIHGVVETFNNIIKNVRPLTLTKSFIFTSFNGRYFLSFGKVGNSTVTFEVYLEESEFTRFIDGRNLRTEIVHEDLAVFRKGAKVSQLLNFIKDESSFEVVYRDVSFKLEFFPYTGGSLIYDEAMLDDYEMSEDELIITDDVESRLVLKAPQAMLYCKQKTEFDLFYKYEQYNEMVYDVIVQSRSEFGKIQERFYTLGTGL